MIKSVLITGANAGLGKECARQLALQGVEKIFLGCRNREKAQAAKRDLETATGKQVFEILMIDVSDLDSVRSAVASLDEPVDALVMNAGGVGGKNFNQKTKAGVGQAFAVNVLGHVLLAESLLEAEKLTKVGLYVGTEASRGVPELKLLRPILKNSSIDEFESVADGSFFNGISDPMEAYGTIKYVATLWLSSIARKFPRVRLITMSPGGTTGTNGTKTLPLLSRIKFKAMMEIAVLIGKMHRLEVGAKRFVDGLYNQSYESGHFYASKNGVTGPIEDQGKIFEDLRNKEYQDNAYKAIHRFLN